MQVDIFSSMFPQLLNWLDGYLWHYQRSGQTNGHQLDLTPLPVICAFISPVPLGLLWLVFFSEDVVVTWGAGLQPGLWCWGSNHATLHWGKTAPPSLPCATVLFTASSLSIRYTHTHALSHPLWKFLPCEKSFKMLLVDWLRPVSEPSFLLSPAWGALPEYIITEFCFEMRRPVLFFLLIVGWLNTLSTNSISHV